MLISEPYRELNAKLHASNPSYGTSGQLYGEYVKAIGEAIGSKDVLDYGCGKCTLQQMLGYVIANYDPCIKGLDSDPKPADLVACTGVLEHIEPENLRAVLEHLRVLTNRIVFVAVAMGPAQKHLEDGRNAHLIQEPFDWWLGKLESCFLTLRYWGTERGFIYIGQSYRDKEKSPDLDHIGPAPTTKFVRTKSVYGDVRRMENIRSSMLRGLPSIRRLPAHDNTFVLACYGPSLADTIEDLRADTGDVFSVSGAHQVLLHNGIVPMGHVEADPRPHKADLIGKPDRRVAYFLGSCCAREVFNLCHGYEQYLFHVASSDDETRLVASLDPVAHVLFGGTNVGMSALSVGEALGYRKFEIYGMDCSFAASPELLWWPNDQDMPPDIRDKTNFHAGFHPNEDQPLYRVWVDGQPFLSSPQMFQGAQDFVVLHGENNGCTYNLHGDGFLKALLAAIEKQKEERRCSMTPTKNTPSGLDTMIGSPRPTV